MHLETDDAQRARQGRQIGYQAYNGPRRVSTSARQALRDELSGSSLSRIWMHKHVPDVKPVAPIGFDVGT